MKNNIPEKIKAVSEKFTKSGFHLFVVGGAVRDLLLQKEVKDWDFTTDATPEQILKIVPEGFYENQFGTVGLKTDLGILEITTMRKEDEYHDFRRPAQVIWTNKIEEDLKRRDFTVNAMALDLTNYELTDPFEGKKDLEGRVIRAVGDAKKRFHEDALRLIRAVRLSTQTGFKIEDETYEQLKLSSNLIEKISWERIRDELFKILASERAFEGMVLLKDSGLMKFVLPEVEKCFEIMQSGPKHARVYDIGEHSFLALKFCPSKDPLVRLAALIHDIGKPNTYKTSPDGNATFYGHEIVGGNLAKKLGERLRLSKNEVEKLYRLVRFHMFTVNEDQTDSAIRRFIKNVGLQNIDDMMAIRIADRLGGGTENAVSWRMEMLRNRIDKVLEKPFSISDLKINGSEVMKILEIKPGPKVGEILNTLFKEVLEDDSKNQKEYLEKRVKEISES